MNVIRIHAEVAPVPVVATHEPLRGIYWRGASGYWSAAKQFRRSGRSDLAAAAFVSARQALTIATAANPKERLSRMVREECGPEPESCFVENTHGKPIEGTPVPLWCPWCGDARMVSLVTRAGPEDPGGASYYATCEGCGAEGPSGSTQLEAAQAWNTRPDSRGARS